MKILITGSSGFIGHHVVKKLLSKNFTIVGLDNLNSYYDRKLKLDRNIELQNFIKMRKLEKKYEFFELDICNFHALDSLFKEKKFDAVIHFAAQAGVRFSLENPKEYLNSNLIGFFNILESLRINKVKKFLFASSSSVYGLSDRNKFKEVLNTDQPVSLYAATKKSNEVLTYSYAKLYEIESVGMRFFTVYGPWGRPDMAYYKFTNAIRNNKPIELYNSEIMERDFTYIGDIVNGIERILNKIKTKNGFFRQEEVKYKIYNLGNNKPVKLSEFVSEIEKVVGKNAKIKNLGIQPGDVFRTSADISLSKKDFNFNPTTKLETGLRNFYDWHISYHK